MVPARGVRSTALQVVGIQLERPDKLRRIGTTDAPYSIGPDDLVV